MVNLHVKAREEIASIHSLTNLFIQLEYLWHVTHCLQSEASLQRGSGRVLIAYEELLAHVIFITFHNSLRRTKLPYFRVQKRETLRSFDTFTGTTVKVYLSQDFTHLLLMKCLSSKWFPIWSYCKSYCYDHSHSFVYARNVAIGIHLVELLSHSLYMT